MENILLVLVFGSGIVDWIATAREWIRLEWFAKPLVMVFLFAWLYAVTKLQGASLWFGIGILFSLIGDVLLLSMDRLFLLGLFAFLITHISYVIGFSLEAASPGVWDIFLAAMILLSAVRVLQRLAPSLRSKGMGRLPVTIYVLAISTMLFFAMRTLANPNWQASATALVSIGAFLFCISDLILGWNRFVNPIKNGRLLNMVAYHLGQIALIVGVVMHFG
jgi:uncharacterized membrane protein YhhN